MNHVTVNILNKGNSTNTPFPICKKINMSTLDKCYQRCVEEIKEKRWRTKKSNIEKEPIELKEVNQ
jgi:hypothetical protein